MRSLKGDTMPGTSSGSWWSRKFWVIVLFPCLAAVLLAGVGVFKGWLHQRAGFDSEGKPLGEAPSIVPEPKQEPQATPRPLVTDTDAYQHIVADLQRRDPEVRPRLRYLTLLHRHNDPTCPNADLEADRRAVRELAALPWQGKAGRVDFIDPEQLLFRIDLQDFGWNAATDWHQIGSHYRYGLGAVGDGPLSKLRQQVEEFTQEAIPVVRADWLVVAITRPPLAGADGLLRTPIYDLPEAVRLLSQRYASQTLGLGACARELGLGDENVLSDLIRRQENLQREFSLAPLLQGGRVRREWWESDRNFISPYQELARLLKVGKPVRVQ